MNERLDTSFLDDALAFASNETRVWVADALACHLHNEGYALEGNTEANDVGWLAHSLWAHDNPMLHANRWEKVSPDEQERYRKTARGVLAVLPQYQMRIAHRLITLSKVVRDIEHAERAQRKARSR